VLEKFSVLLFKLRIATYKKTGSGLVQHFAGRFRGVEKIKNHIVIEPSVQIKFELRYYLSYDKFFKTRPYLSTVARYFFNTKYLALNTGNKYFNNTNNYFYE